MDKLYRLCEEVGGHFDGCELHCVSYCNDGMGREREGGREREEEGRERGGRERERRKGEREREGERGVLKLC